MPKARLETAGPGTTVTSPPPGGTTVIRDEEYGASVENRIFVVLSVRVAWQDETRELASGEVDLSLEAAASKVARELEKLAKQKGRRPGP
jgi:hypothetical protein